MSISGLAITLTRCDDDARTAIGALRARADIELGEQNGSRLAVTTDTRSTKEDRDLWDWIGALPGVEQVDVVFVAFEESPQ